MNPVKKTFVHSNIIILYEESKNKNNLCISYNCTVLILKTACSKPALHSADWDKRMTSQFSAAISLIFLGVQCFGYNKRDHCVRGWFLHVPWSSVCTIQYACLIVSVSVHVSHQVCIHLQCEPALSWSPSVAWWMSISPTLEVLEACYHTESGAWQE